MISSSKIDRISGRATNKKNKPFILTKITSTHQITLRITARSLTTDILMKKMMMIMTVKFSVISLGKRPALSQ